MTDGQIAWAERELGLAEERMREAIHISATQGDRVNIGFLARVLARVLLDLGRDADAEDLLLDFRENRPVPTARANASSIAAVVAARRGEISQACRLAEEAVAIAMHTEC